MNNVNVVFPFLFQNDTTIECQYTEFNINTTGAYLLFRDKNIYFGRFAKKRCFLVGKKASFSHVGPFSPSSNPFWCMKRVHRHKSCTRDKIAYVQTKYFCSFFQIFRRCLRTLWYLALWWVAPYFWPKLVPYLKFRVVNSDNFVN